MTNEDEQLITWAEIDRMMALEKMFNGFKPLAPRQRVGVLTRIIQRNSPDDELALAALALIHETLQEIEKGEWMFSLGTGCIPPSAPARIKALARAYDEARTIGEKTRLSHAFVYAWNDWIDTQLA